MSLPDSSSERPRGVLVRQPRSSIFTVLLLIAFAALVIGCLILVVELARYGFQFKPPSNLRTAAPTIVDRLLA